MDLGIAGRVALVTAASKGLGLASAAALATDGARIAITGRTPEVLERAAADLEATTGTAVLRWPGNTPSRGEPERAVAATVARFGRLDILVANAGGPPPARSLDVTDDQILDAVNANLLTTVRLIRAALPHLEASDQGRICAITSYSIVQPIPTLALSNLA